MEFSFYITIIAAFRLCLGQNTLASEIEYTDADEGCVLDSKTERLQIAWAFDITTSNIKNVKTFRKHIKKIMNALNEIHDGTEFALTTHGNYDEMALEPRGHRDLEGCYTRLVNFTTDTGLIAKVASKVKEADSDVPPYEENALPALAFVVTDSSIGWVKGTKDETGRNVHKVVILFTDQWSIFELGTPGRRTKFKGDGTDTCKGSLPATRNEVGMLLNKHNIKIIGAYVGMKDKNYKKYNDFFDEFNIRHDEKRFKRKSGELEMSLVQFVTESVKSILACYYEEPEGYNSLGL